MLQHRRLRSNPRWFAGPAETAQEYHQSYPIQLSKASSNPASSGKIKCSTDVSGSFSVAIPKRNQCQQRSYGRARNRKPDSLFDLEVLISHFFQSDHS